MSDFALTLVTGGAEKNHFGPPGFRARARPEPITISHTGIDLPLSAVLPGVLESILHIIYTSTKVHCQSCNDLGDHT